MGQSTVSSYIAVKLSSALNQHWGCPSMFLGRPQHNWKPKKGQKRVQPPAEKSDYIVTTSKLEQDF